MTRATWLSIVVLAGSSIAAQPAQKRPTITIVSGSYGASCKQPKGNKSAFLAKACDGSRHCNYIVQVSEIGDPAVGCSKDYVAEWKCGDSPTIHRAALPPEAAGGNIVLSCEEPKIVQEGKYPTGTIGIVAGTYGATCKQPRGNRTDYLIAACNGKQTCSYKVSVKDLGDPTPGCAKDYVAEWRCGDSTVAHRGSIDPEAGSGQVLELSCQSSATLAAALKADGTVDVRGIYFDLDKSSIRPDSKPVLDEVAKLLTGNASLRLEVAGHTDNTGDGAHNLQLSQARAQAVVQTLVATYGIAETRLQAKGYGATKPVGPNDTEENRARNRRVELRKL